MTIKGPMSNPDWFMRYNSRHCSLQQHKAEAGFYIAMKIQPRSCAFVVKVRDNYIT